MMVDFDNQITDTKHIVYISEIDGRKRQVKNSTYSFFIELITGRILYKDSTNKFQLEVFRKDLISLYQTKQS